MWTICVSIFQTALRSEDQKPKTPVPLGFQASIPLQQAHKTHLNFRTITYRPHGTVYVIFLKAAAALQSQQHTQRWHVRFKSLGTNWRWVVATGPLSSAPYPEPPPLLTVLTVLTVTTPGGLPPGLSSRLRRGRKDGRNRLNYLKN